MKKLFGIFLAAVTVIAACVGFSGCKQKPAGTLYSLQEAYEYGFLTKEDLEQIAYYNNKNEKPEKELDPKIEQKIKEALAEERTKNDWNYDFYGRPAQAEDFEIEKYYGEYRGCYAFRKLDKTVSYPAYPFMEWVEIGGVEFCFGYVRPQIWKINT